MILAWRLKPLGTVKTATERRSKGIPPKSMKGRNLPHLVMVLSTKRPATMSEAASQMRTRRKSVPTNAKDKPATSV